MLPSAIEISAGVRAGTLSAVDIVDECLRRIDMLDGDIRAWAELDREGARLTARQRYEASKHGAVSGALFGVPVGVKDIFDVGGLPTRAGAAPFFHYTADRDSTAVARLRDSGAIILGKTATTQFAYGDAAETANPWSGAHTPGGSSSGSAAAVAAGMASVAIGSQTVGSTLRPAAYCGVVGLKPAHGRISAAGVVPLAWSLDHVGIFARTVADASLVLGVLAGYDGADPYSFEAPVEDYTPRPLADPPRIGVLRSFYQGRCDAEVSEHLDAVVSALAAAGAHVVDAALAWASDEIVAVGMDVMRAEAAAYHREHFALHADEYMPRIRGLVQAGLDMKATQYVDAQRRRSELRADLLRALGQFDALLLPVAPGPAPKGLDSTGDPVFCAPASFAGLPAISLPSGLSRDRLPLALQLVAGPLAEARLLSVTAWVEGVLAFSEGPPLHA